MPRHTRLGLTALTAAAAIALTACSSSGGGDSKPTGSAAANAPVTISFMEAMASGSQKPALEHLVSQFHAAHPNVTVNLVPEPDYGTLRTKETAAVAAHNPPTIGQAYPDWAATFSDSGAIVPLSTFQDTGNELSSFYAGIKKDLYLGDGKLWMWPFNKSVIVAFYNTKLLNGQKFPTTWDQFATVAKSLPKGTVGLAIDPGTEASPQGGTSLFETMASAWGTPVYKDDGTPQFDTPASEAALQYLVDLKNSGGLAIGTNYPGQTSLGAGKGLADISSVASYPYDLQAAGGKFTMGTAAIPAGPKGSANALAGTNVVMFAKASAAEQQAAWQFMQFLDEPEQQAYWALNSGYLPVTSKALPIMQGQGMATKTPYMSAAVSQLDVATDEPPYGWVTETDGDLANGLQSALSGHSSPKDALKTAQSAAMSHMQSSK